MLLLKLVGELLVTYTSYLHWLLVVAGLKNVPVVLLRLAYPLFLLTLLQGTFLVLKQIC